MPNRTLWDFSSGGSYVAGRVHRPSLIGADAPSPAPQHPRRLEKFSGSRSAVGVVSDTAFRPSGAPESRSSTPRAWSVEDRDAMGQFSFTTDTFATREGGAAWMVMSPPRRP